MMRIALILLIAGLFLIGAACYDLFVQAGASRQPTTVSVAELEKSVPSNRHLIVTGGRPVAANAVKSYKKQWGTKVSGSEILFIPIADASNPAWSNSIPFLLLRVTEDQIDAAKAGKKVNFKAIEGIRTTSMDLRDKVRQRLVAAYGQAAVDRMIILNYHGAIGMGPALVKLAGGVVLVGVMVAAFIFGRERKESTPPLVGAAPPVIGG